MAKMGEKAIYESLQTGKCYRFLAKEEIGVMEASTSNAYNISFNNEIELVRCYHSFSAAGPHITLVKRFAQLCLSVPASSPSATRLEHAARARRTVAASSDGARGP
jgi:hypothetical protein